MRRSAPAIALAFATTLCGAAAAQSGDASVAIRWTGIKAAEGKVTVALFDSEAAFKATKNPVRTAEVPAAAGSVETAWTGLKPGRYAAVAYHDRDANGKLNTLPVGLPTEAYGFSNNARGRFGPPSWSAASFEVRPGANAQTAALK